VLVELLYLVAMTRGVVSQFDALTLMVVLILWSSGKYLRCLSSRNRYNFNS